MALGPRDQMALTLAINTQPGVPRLADMPAGLRLKDTQDSTVAIDRQTLIRGWWV